MAISCGWAAISNFQMASNHRLLAIKHPADISKRIYGQHQQEDTA
jgi:hypothetical protein